MSFFHVSGFDQAIPMYCSTSSTIVANQLVVFDRSNGKVIPATAALLTEDNAGVSQNTPAAGDSFVNVIAIIGNPSQIWQWDCTNNTATNQLCKRSLLTDGLTVNNTATDQAVDETVVTPLRNIGAAADKKQQGYINLVPATLS